MERHCFWSWTSILHLVLRTVALRRPGETFGLATSLTPLYSSRLT